MNQSPQRPHLPTLIGGLAAVGVGVVLLLDRLDAFTLKVGWLLPLLLAGVGAYLLTAGLTRSRR